MSLLPQQPVLYLPELGKEFPGQFETDFLFPAANRCGIFSNKALP